MKHAFLLGVIRSIRDLLAYVCRMLVNRNKQSGNNSKEDVSHDIQSDRR